MLGSSRRLVVSAATLLVAPSRVAVVASRGLAAAASSKSKTLKFKLEVRCLLAGVLPLPSVQLIVVNV